MWRRISSVTQPIINRASSQRLFSAIKDKNQFVDNNLKELGDFVNQLQKDRDEVWTLSRANLWSKWRDHRCELAEISYVLYGFHPSTWKHRHS